MSVRNILQEFSQYQLCRLKFCQMIAEYATKAQNIPYLESEGAIELICPLLSDPQLPIRLNAICCFGRMANQSMKVATTLMERSVPQSMLRELILDRNNNVHFKRAIMQAIKGIAKHSPELAIQVVECGGLSACLICMEEQDVSLKESAACGIGCIVRQSADLATNAINQGAVTLLVMCIQHNELSLKQVAACVLGDIARHSVNHAQAICDAGGLIHLSRALDNIDTKLKKQALSALANIASHNRDLAEFVVEAEVFPKVLIHLGHEKDFVQKQGARLVQEIVKHSLELAQLVVNSGGIGALVQLLMNCNQPSEDIVTSAASALGFIAGQSPHFALAVIECKGVVALAITLNSDRPDCQLAACVWALGHIGKHTPEHSRALAEVNVFIRMLELYSKDSSSLDLKNKCKCALKMVLQCCLHLPSLEPLLYNAPIEILKYILGQFSKVLPNDPSARRLFITTGGLKKIQEIDAIPGTHLCEYITIINSCYPDDIIRYYTPGFPDTILERIEQYIPQPFEPMLSENLASSSCIDIFNKQIGDGDGIQIDTDMKLTK